MTRRFRSLIVDDHGQDLIEYSLLASLLSVVSIASLVLLGPAVAGVWTRLQSPITSTIGGH